MKTQAKPEAPKAPPARRAAPAEPPRAKREDHPFHIVPPPPVPGQTAWSIVPW